ncbi:hypothetical protein EG68_04413 [Paragonimus skrjabini miyazakii]|uniref:RNA-binding S4 domain-containing protein n=1 Tax=Paragonimus skrjabini miyazakii TaxID=59628 RepID=A0A8S9Z7A5_9TREM|nr:hypothetical protein EG68_04413 [Paragonimus skrjabini miyazakii]
MFARVVFHCVRKIEQRCTRSSPFLFPCVQDFVTINPVRLASKNRGRRIDSHANIDSDSDSEEDRDQPDWEVDEDRFHAEDVRFNPNFRQLTAHVHSVRFDKVLRSGLNLTRAAADEAFLSSRLRLNGEKLLKKSTPVEEGDRLDMILGEDDDVVYGKRPNRLKTFLINRPPLALAGLILLLSGLGLIAVDVRFRLQEVKDPDVETHWNQLLLELSKLEFCLSNSTGAKTLSESFAAAEMLPQKLVPNCQVDENIIAHSVEQRVLLLPTSEFRPGTVYMVTATMRGRHIGIKGPLALHPFNVTFKLYTTRLPISNGIGGFIPVRLTACVTLTSSKQILPPRTLRGACRNRGYPSPDQSKLEFGRLEWTKRSDVFGTNRCDRRVRLRTDFHLHPDLLPVLKEKDMALISFHLKVLITFLFVLLFCLLGLGTLFTGRPSRCCCLGRRRLPSSFLSSSICEL